MLSASLRRLPPACTALLVLAVVAAGCSAPGTNLEPAPSANEAGGLAEAAVNTVDNVRVVAQADAWTGDSQVTLQVTPVRVVMENSSDRPVRIRYDQFALVNPQGARYAALPPYGVEGSIEEPVLTEGYAPVTSPAFTYSGFSVAPYYAPAYPTISSYSGPFYYDRGYYDRYYTTFAEIPLPTEAMVAQALPEGVLEPGGRVDGFLYFERVDPDAPRVRFRADLVGARDGDVFGEVSIPFVTEG